MQHQLRARAGTAGQENDWQRAKPILESQLLRVSPGQAFPPRHGRYALVAIHGCIERCELRARRGGSLTTCDREAVAVLGEAIAQHIGEPRYRLWFDGKTKLIHAGDQLTVGGPTCCYPEWWEKKFADAVHAAAREVLGQEMQVRFVIDAGLFQAARREQEQHPQVTSSQPTPPANVMSPARATQRLRTWRLLKEFVVGPCNRLAY